MADRPEIFKYMETYYDELEPVEFYRQLFDDGAGLAAEEDKKIDGVYAYHVTALDFSENRAKPRHLEIWHDLKALDALKPSAEIYIPAVSYVGFRRVNKNARFLYAMTLDIDDLRAGKDGTSGINDFFYQCENGVYPYPWAVVCSGEGVHLYYKFDRPIPCYEYNLHCLQRLKHGLTDKIHGNITTRTAYKSNIQSSGKPDYESITQAMRAVGTRTKGGNVARAFLTGEPVSLIDLDAAVPEKWRAGSLEKRSKYPLAFCRQVWPDWYERRVIEKKPFKVWAVNRAVYDSFLRSIKTDAKYNHRYFAVMCLAILAEKCSHYDAKKNPRPVTYEELEKDAYSLLPLLDALTEDENNHFTEYDIKAALKAFEASRGLFSRDLICDLSAIDLKPNRRNGRSQAEHLKRARAVAAVARENGANKGGRPSAWPIVKKWRSDNPQGDLRQCLSDTGLKQATIYKYWKAAAPAASSLLLPPSADPAALSDEQRRVRASLMKEIAELLPYESLRDVPEALRNYQSLFENATLEELRGVLDDLKSGAQESEKSEA